MYVPEGLPTSSSSPWACSGWLGLRIRLRFGHALVLRLHVSVDPAGGRDFMREDDLLHVTTSALS